MFPYERTLVVHFNSYSSRRLVNHT